MPHRSIKHVIAGIIALGLLIVSQAICYTPVVAQTAVVRFEPAPLTVGEGMTSAVSIRVENVQKLYGVDVRVSFDPTAVEVVDADESAEGVQVRPGDLLNLDFLARNSADNEHGTIWFALSQMNPSEEVTGGGEAFVVTFRGKTKGATSPLEITYVKMSDREGKVIQADKEDSLVDVVDSSNAPATPTTAPTLPSPTLVAPTHPPATATPIRPTATATPIVPTATVTPTAAPTDTPVPTNPPTSSPIATQVAQQAFTATPMPARPTDTVAPVQVGGDTPIPASNVESTPMANAESAAQSNDTPQAIAAAAHPPTSTPQVAPGVASTTSSSSDLTIPLAILAALGGMAFLIAIAILGVIAWRATRRSAQ